MLVVVVLAPVVAALLWAAWIWIARVKERQRRLAEHRGRSRRIFGCLECGVEIVPPAVLLRCGVCREDSTLCLRCGLGSPFGRAHPHDDWHEDTVSLETAWRVPQPLSLPNVMANAFAQWGERPLLCDAETERWMSYAEVGHRVDVLARHMLHDLGLVPGDRVVVHAPSRPSFYLVQWACFRAALVPVPVAERTPAGQVAELIRLSEPRVVFSLQDNVVPGGFALWRSEEELDEIFAASQRLTGPLPVAASSGESLAMLLPTSGTTGTPKLVCFTDAMLARTASQIPKQGSEMVLLAYQPLRQAVDVLSKGGRIACCDWGGSLEALLRAARRVRPTVFGGMPSLFSALEAFEDTSNLLGNRVRTVVIGGAKSSPQQKKWIFTNLGCVVLDGYGSTETGGLSLNGESDAANLILVDCPSRGYMTSDIPRPRGEILSVVSQRTTPGYYKNDAATAECIVELGGKRYWRTGDIGEKTEAGITVIDRMRNFFKLSNGLFVAPSQLEALFVQCEAVRQCYVFAADDGECVMAAVVPWHPETTTEVQVLAQMQRAGEHHQLASHEIPRRVLLDPESWNEANGLLSSIGKLCRPVLAKRFRVASARDLPLPPLGPDSGIGSGVAQLVQETLGAVAHDAATPLTLLGATSVSLAALQRALRDRYGAAVELKRLGQLTVGELASLMLGDGDVSQQAPRKHRNWQAEVDVIVLNPCRDVPREGAAAVFLTGSSGFLGAFLLSELLSQTELDVICLVRAPTDEAAMERIRATCRHYGLAIDEKRVWAVAGALEEPHLGLGSREAFEKLARSRNFVVLHNAALVNSALPYEGLRGANVLGTAAMLELAAGRPFHHVSTIGLLSSSGTTSEEEMVSPRALG
jgi:fatty acid CoA ligase FadD9